MCEVKNERAELLSVCNHWINLWFPVGARFKLSKRWKGGGYSGNGPQALSTKQNKTNKTKQKNLQKQPQTKIQTKNLSKGCCEREKCIKVHKRNREVVEGKSTKGYETEEQKQLRKSPELKIAGGWKNIKYNYHTCIYACTVLNSSSGVCLQHQPDRPLVWISSGVYSSHPSIILRTTRFWLFTHCSNISL